MMPKVTGQQSASPDGWRGPIFRHFTPEIAAATRLTIVGDPDQLLTEQGVLDGIRERGFDLIQFDDPMKFRYAYESCYRQIWDRGEDTNLVVVLQHVHGDAEALPFDLLLEARRTERLLHFSIADIFPHLSPSVVADLPRTDLDRLYTAQLAHPPDPLAELATADYILRHVFEVDPILLQTEVDLLRTLLRRHYRRRSVPARLDDRLIQQLRLKPNYAAWPLEQIVPGREAFLEFLQERWPRFLRTIIDPVAQADHVSEPVPPRPLRFQGPELLPFGHDDIRVYVDNLFVEGMLEPTSEFPRSAVRGSWAESGVAAEDPGTEARSRLHRLSERIEAAIPDLEANHQAWLQFAWLWAEWLTLRFGPYLVEGAPETDAASVLHERVETSFALWLERHYASLHNLAPHPRPVMVHQVLGHLRRALDGSPSGRSGRKLALLVLDGLALDQWLILRDVLRADRCLPLPSEEWALFTWIPTLTTFCRQSIFAGSIPLYFSNYLQTTSREKEHWLRFWEEHRVTRPEVGFVVQHEREQHENFLQRIREAAEAPRTRVISVVVGTIDTEMHGTTLGTGGLHSVVRHWAESHQPSEILALLLDRGFEVFLTSDHGNIEGWGTGDPNVGSTTQTRGARALIFSDESLRNQTLGAFPDSIAWPPIGLPENCRPLLAPGRTSFIPTHQHQVTHGSISLEETIVPLLHFARSR